MMNMRMMMMVMDAMRLVHRVIVCKTRVCTGSHHAAAVDLRHASGHSDQVAPTFGSAAKCTALEERWRIEIEILTIRQRR